MPLARYAGVLMHITSLPSPGAWVPWGKKLTGSRILKAAGRNIGRSFPWGPPVTVIPLSILFHLRGEPLSHRFGPALPGWPAGKEEYESLDWGSDPLKVDYQALYRNRFQVLRLAYERALPGTRRNFSGSGGITKAG